MRRAFVTVFSAFILFFSFAACGYCVDSSGGISNTEKTSQVQSGGMVNVLPDVSTGVKAVSVDQMVSKVSRIVSVAYLAAAKISPQITLLILALGGLIGYFFRGMRNVALWAIVGLVIVLWAPQLVGLFVSLLNS